MAIGNVPQEDGFTGLFGSISKGIDQQTQTAMQLKMHTSLMERQQQLAQQAEQERYNREQSVSPEALGVLSGVAKKYGLGDLGIDKLSNQREFQTAAGMIQHLATVNKMTNPASNEDQVDPGTGITTGKNVLNGMGTVIRTMPAPGAKEKMAQHGELTQFVQNLDHSMMLHDSLSAPGGGKAGVMLNKIATNMPGGQTLMPERAELSKLADATSILQGKMLDRVPGGKSSLGLGTKSEGYQIRAETSPTIVKDIYDNSTYQAYRQLTAMGPNVVMPQNIREKFAWLPHDANGNPVNVVWRSGQPYLPGHDKVPLVPPPAVNQATQGQQAKSDESNPYLSYDFDHLSDSMGQDFKSHKKVMIERQKQAEKAKGN